MSPQLHDLAAPSYDLVASSHDLAAPSYDLTHDLYTQSQILILLRMGTT